MRKKFQFLQFISTEINKHCRAERSFPAIAGIVHSKFISRITSKSNFLRISSKSSELTHPPTSEHDPLQVEQTISTMASYQITNLLEKVRNMRILTFHIEIFLQIIYERDGNGNLWYCVEISTLATKKRWRWVAESSIACGLLFEIRWISQFRRINLRFFLVG